MTNEEGTEFFCHRKYRQTEVEITWEPDVVRLHAQLEQCSLFLYISSPGISSKIPAPKVKTRINVVL
jgi:hypothetical protein